MNPHPVLIPVASPAAARTPACVEQQREHARLALSCSAALCGAPADGWQNDAEGRPLPNLGFHWSVSHKREWVAAVVADEPVGIDVEHILPRRAEILDELAAGEEWEILDDRSWHSFFRLWTAKEAVLKANGLGIGRFRACRLASASDLRHMMLVHEGVEWPVEHCYLPDHVAAIACHCDAITWHTHVPEPDHGREKTPTRDQDAAPRTGSRPLP
jgi:4'-phosphopantetheinyl transferase